MKLITSRDNPFFKELLKLAGSSRERTKSGQALLDGTHLLTAYLDSGATPAHILLNSAALRDAEVETLLKRASGVSMTQLDDKLFAELSELKTLTGIVTLIEIPASRGSADESRFCLLLEDIQEPRQFGSIQRSAAAAG
jgi:TrmH family RNA methyltransferase